MMIQPILHTPAYMYPWDKRTLYMGTLPEPLNVAYGAATLVVSLGHAISVRMAGNAVQGFSFLIPAGLPVTINASLAPIAICHLDVLGDDYHRFNGCFKHYDSTGVIACDLNDEADYRMLLNTLYRQPESSTHAFHLVDNLIEYSFNQAGNTSMIDQKVLKAVQHIKSHYQDNIPIEELAKQVQISTPSLIRKFRQQSGIPIRRFRLWHRIYESMLFISAGQNLTDAAISAGFSDSPHYTHTLQTMWGVSPRSLFAKEIRAEIVPPEWP